MHHFTLFIVLVLTIAISAAADVTPWDLPWHEVSSLTGELDQVQNTGDRPEVADIDGDGFDDVCSIHSSLLPTRALAIRWGGDTPFEDATILHVEGDILTLPRATLADFDGDDDMDILVYNVSARAMGVFRNLGNRVFEYESVAEVFDVYAFLFVPASKDREGGVIVLYEPHDDMLLVGFYQRQPNGWEMTSSLVLNEKNVSIGSNTFSLSQHDLDAEHEFAYYGYLDGRTRYVVFDVAEDSSLRIIRDEIAPSQSSDPRAWFDLDQDGLSEHIHGSRHGVHIENGADASDAAFYPFDTPSAFRFGDFNHDGACDLLVSGSEGTHIFQNTGDIATFEQRAIDDFGHGEFQLAIVDADNDGLLDICRFIDGSIYANYAVAPFRFTYQRVMQDPRLPNAQHDAYDFVPFDVDQNGVEDLVVFTRDRANEFPAVFSWDPMANEYVSFQEPLFREQSNAVLLLFDVDNNGEKEIVQVGEEGVTTYYQFAPFQFFPRTSVLPELKFILFTQPVALDFTRDGVLDIVYNTNDRLYVFAGDGEGNFALHTDLEFPNDQRLTAVPSPDPAYMFDFLYFQQPTDDMVVYRWRPGSAFKPIAIVPFPQQSMPFSMRVLDYDRDGELEALALTRTGVCAFESNDQARYDAPQLIFPMQARNLSWPELDFDLDGDIDTLVTTDTRAQTLVLDGLPLGSDNVMPVFDVFAPQTPFDHDGDGDIDIIRVTENYITVIKNQMVMPCRYDMNLDGSVDQSELALLMSAWGAGDLRGHDYDRDGDVDTFDLAVILANWGLCP